MGVTTSLREFCTPGFVAAGLDVDLLNQPTAHFLGQVIQDTLPWI